MKNYLLYALLMTTAGCFAAKPNPDIQRHQFNVSMTNGVSFSVFNGNLFPYHAYEGYYPMKDFDQNQMRYGYTPPSHIAYLPTYSMHLKMDYSLGISDKWRLETGIGYVLQGIVMKYTDTEHSSSTTYLTYGSLTVPIHAKYTKRMPKGDFTCTFGPNFMLPVHEFYRTYDVFIYGRKGASQSGHRSFNTHSTSDNSSMGFDIKFGYETKLKDGLSINAGPVINVVNGVPFHYRRLIEGDKLPYGIYACAGIDVAIIFGLKK